MRAEPQLPGTPDGNERLTVLVAESTRHGGALLLEFVNRLGHRVVTAYGADEVMAMAAVGAPDGPDLIIADLQLAAEEPEQFITGIRAAAGRWVPMLLMAGESDESLLIRALDAGAEDYIPKPIRYSVLAARLGSMLRRLRESRELEARNFELAAYRANEEEESHVARHVISKLIRADLLHDRALQHWVRPAGTYFSGDIVLAARTPSGDLHVLLADAAGHGLAAALNALPVTQPFYAMTEKGFSLDRIVAEINRKIRDLLPIDRFVAASAISVNFREQVISIWNGGCPPVLVLDADGNVIHSSPSRRLPLGIVDELQFSSGLDAFRYDRRCQVVACSDGMVEISEPGGAMLGGDGLVALLSGEPAGRRMPVLQSAVAAILGGTNAADDISVLMVDCLPLAAAAGSLAEQVDSGPVAHAGGGWRMAFSLSADELKYVDAVPLLLNIVKSMACGKPHGSHVFVILSELFNNALDHGLLGLDSKIKLEEDGFTRYMDLRARGLASLSRGTIDVEIGVIEVEGQSMLQIVVRDSGKGFDHRRFRGDMPDAAQPFGRGIATVRKLCEKVEYRGCGNEAVVHFALEQGAPENPPAPAPGVKEPAPSLSCA